jgi:Tfp pilus assembly protein PilO
MASQQNNIKNKYLGMKRRFEDTVFVNRVYMILAIVSVLIIGYFGIFRLFKIVQTKRALEKQLVEINTSLESNLAQFARLENDILSSSGLLDNISVFMPSTFSTEEYVVQLSEAVSGSGFILRRVTATESDTKEGGRFVILSAKVDGPGNPVDLVTSIERLKRITRVTGMNYTLNTHSSVKGDGDVTINLEIYKAENL